MQPGGLGRLLRALPIFGAIIYALGMSMFWANSGGAPWRGDPGAYQAVAALGIMVLMTLSFQEKRIWELEQRQAARDGRPPGSASSA
jgi:hypothetical protein